MVRNPNHCLFQETIVDFYFHDWISKIIIFLFIQHPLYISKTTMQLVYPGIYTKYVTSIRITMQWMYLVVFVAKLIVFEWILWPHISWITRPTCISKILERVMECQTLQTLLHSMMGKCWLYLAALLGLLL